MNLEDVSRACKGVTAAFFVIHIESDQVRASTIFALAAKENGLKVIVNMSQAPARREATSSSNFSNWLGERIFDWAGTPVIHIRPTFFAQWLFYRGIIDGIKKGEVQYGWSTGKHAPIACEDQARFVAAVLQEPAAHIGKTYPLFGPKEYTAAELFEEVSRVLGREVKYKTLSEGEFKKVLPAQTMPIFSQHMQEVVKDHTNGAFGGTDHIIKEVTGKSPMGIEEFVRRHEKAFEACSS